MVASLDRLLRPKSIATIGGSEAAAALRACRRMGFAGEVWPVHPNQTVVDGLRCYPSVDELPAAPDASFVGVNRERTIDVIRHLAKTGAGGAVAYASGFKESDETGKQLQTTLVEAAGTLPVLGPNCYGFINYLDGALLWPDQHGGARVERGVALIMQSSNVAINLTMNRRALPIAYVVCLGNQANVDLADVMHAVAEDGRVSAIGLYVEGLGDVQRFADAAEAMTSRDLPVVALRGGRSSGGAEQAISHTASIIGDGAVISALLKRLGIAEVASLSVLLETLKVLHVHGRLDGRRLLSLSCSGGEAALMADSAGGTDVSFPAFSNVEQSAVEKTTHPLVKVNNPFDYHTFDWTRPARLKSTFDAVLAADIDMAALVLDWPRDDRADPKAWHQPLETWCQALNERQKPGAVIASLPENLPENRAEKLIEAGVVPLLGIDDALKAIDAAAGSKGSNGPALLRLSPPANVINDHTVITLDELAAKTWLAEYGLPLPRSEQALSVEDAIEAAERVGYPVALKALGIAHKTEADAVRLNLRSADAVKVSAEDLKNIGDRFLVETMIDDSVAELIVGAAIDPVVGLHLVLGSGGVLVDLMDDSEVLILPASAGDIRACLSRLKVGRLLAGFRGRPQGDVDAAIQAVQDVQRLLLDHLDQVIEMDINPLIVRPKGRGVAAVDALFRLKPAQEG